MFAREPVPGRVKTRLAAGIGPEQAARLYEAFLLDTLDTLRATGRPFAVGYRGEGAGPYFHTVAPGAVDCFPQQGDDLGARMVAAFRRYFQRRFQKIVLIGSDCPLLAAADLRDAFAALEDCPAVLGPARDGGYYLVGLSHEFPELFTGIEWGTKAVLCKTIAALKREGCSFQLLEELADIDRVSDLDTFASGGEPSDRVIPPHTRQVISELYPD